MSAKDSTEEEKLALDASTSSDKNPSTLSSDVPPEVQKKDEDEEEEEEEEGGAARQADISASSAGQETPTELPEVQTPEECVEEGEEEKEGWSRADIKGTERRRSFQSNLTACSSGH